jgi:hypothetical protein
MKRVLTQADIEANPQLQLDGYKAGDTYDDGVQDTDTETDTEGTGEEKEETNENANEEATDDTGGGAPPPDKPRDDA